VTSRRAPTDSSGDLFALDGVTATVTGSSRGIGLAIARVLLGQGAQVLVNGYDAKETERAVESLQQQFPTQHDARTRVAGLAGDVTERVIVDGLIEEAVRVFGDVDYLVCNAGIDIIKPALEYAPEEWDRVLAVNLKGVFQPAQAIARYWIERGRGGAITMTSSIAGSVGIPTLAPYAASKGGVNQLVRTLAAEWAPHGIRVNAVAPGYVANIMDNVTAHDNPASDQRINTFTPLGRRASVEEIAAPFAFLASPAASYITGSVLAVDGGYTAT
jgi:NAD(P)-dependent dehydrogenase (short-subunit alcohol dehydrogenase family)